MRDTSSTAGPEDSLHVMEVESRVPVDFSVTTAD